MTIVPADHEHEPSGRSRDESDVSSTNDPEHMHVCTAYMHAREHRSASKGAQQRAEELENERLHVKVLTDITTVTIAAIMTAIVFVTTIVTATVIVIAIESGRCMLNVINKYAKKTNNSMIATKSM